ncbi:unnamed protein product, partial [Amoebophrya sp. A120]
RRHRRSKRKLKRLQRPRKRKPRRRQKRKKRRPRRLPRRKSLPLRRSEPLKAADFSQHPSGVSSFATCLLQANPRNATPS